MSPEAGRVDPRQLHVGFLRAGDALMDRSKLSPDYETRNGIEQALDVLESGPILIFDAHRTWMDIGFSAARLTGELPIKKYVIPYAAYLRDRRFYRPLVLNIGHQVDGVEMMPVVREEDQIGYDGEFAVRPRGVAFTKEETSVLNRAYMKEALDLIKENQPMTAIFLAPYASRRTYRKWFRVGVLGLVKKGLPVLATLSKKDSAFKLDHTTFVSGELLKFDKNSLNANIIERFDEQFRELERRASIS